MTMSVAGDNRVSFESVFDVGTALADSEAHVGEVPLAGLPCGIALEIANTGGAALTDLALQAQDDDGGGWYTVLHGADWADGTIATLRFCSDGSCATLSAGRTVHLWLDVAAPCRLRIAAACATGTSLRVRGTAAGR